MREYIRTVHRLFTEPDPSTNDMWIIFMIGVATGALFVFLLTLPDTLRMMMVV
jgi:hypothetical protein